MRFSKFLFLAVLIFTFSFCRNISASEIKFPYTLKIFKKSQSLPLGTITFNAAGRLVLKLTAAEEQSQLIVLRKYVQSISSEPTLSYANSPVKKGDPNYVQAFKSRLEEQYDLQEVAAGNDKLNGK